MAYSLSKKQPNISKFSIGFIPHLILLAIMSVLLLFQPDFGTIFIFCLIVWIMMFVAGVKLVHLGTPLLFIIPLLTFIMIKAPYRLERIMIFWDPWQYPTDGGYQIIHSLMAFGTGGLFGTGIGQSYQKLFYLPEPHTDFIFSVIGEETGFMGVLLILVMYVWIMCRGIFIAKNAENIFGSLLATGIVSALAVQVTVNMGVALGLLPTKGLTLPFLSYGGTSLLINMAAMGILMNIGGKMKNAR
jgi:cell division protein FtsW